MKVYPLQELLLIRKDMKNFKESKETILSTITPVISNKIENNNTSNINSTRNTFRIIPEYDNIIEILNIEKTVVERKLLLFSEKRIEEQEVLNLKLKRKEKKKIIQDFQSKDPSNFTNQKRF